MALFSRKKETKAKETTTKKGAATVSKTPTVARNLETVIIKPRITEKAVGKLMRSKHSLV
jgi:hypothetical protein